MPLSPVWAEPPRRTSRRGLALAWISIMTGTLLIILATGAALVGAENLARLT